MTGRATDPPGLDAWRDRRRRRALWRDLVALTAATVGIGIAIWALTGAYEAQGDNRRDIRDTAATVLQTCRTSNRTRPQIQINSMINTDAALVAVGADLELRRLVAAEQVRAAAPELQPGRSIGFRDCDESGSIDRGDFIPGEPLPPGALEGIPRLLGDDELPISLEGSP